MGRSEMSCAEWKQIAGKASIQHREAMLSLDGLCFPAHEAALHAIGDSCQPAPRLTPAFMCSYPGSLSGWGRRL